MDPSCLDVSFVPAIRVKIVYERKYKAPVQQKVQKVRLDLVESVGEKRSMFQREMEKIQNMEQTNVCAAQSTFPVKPDDHHPHVQSTQNSSVITMHPADLLRLIRQRKQMSVAQSVLQDVTETSTLSDDSRKRKCSSLSESEEKPAKRPRYKFNPDYVWTNNRINAQCSDDDDDLELDQIAKEIERDLLQHLNSESTD